MDHAERTSRRDDGAAMNQVHNPMNRKIVTSVAVLSLLAVAITACVMGTTNPLANTKWNVTDYSNPANPTGMTTVLLGPAVTMDFAATGTLSGSGGCNTYSGTYKVDGQSLTISPLQSTMMACATPEGVMEQEAAFLTALQSTRSYKLEGTQLDLLDEKGQLQVLATKQE